MGATLHHTLDTPGWAVLPLATFFHVNSSNGKSVTWAQNERGSRGNHLWKRLSLHIKKRESNQTAVIKPFSKGPEGRYGGDVTPESSAKMLYEVSEVEEHYPVPTYRPQTPSPISTVSQRAPSLSRGHDGPLVPTYLSEQPPQRPGLPSQGSLMDQISCVVNRFTANISELNSMMLSSTPVAGTPVGAVVEACPPHFLIPREIQLPTTMTTFAEVQPVPAMEANGCSQAAGRASPASDRDATPGSPAVKSELEELATLTPPSPFRDSIDSGSASPTSPVSESALCMPASPKYDRLVLRDYISLTRSTKGFLVFGAHRAQLPLACHLTAPALRRGRGARDEDEERQVH
ncbi:metabotropic glutamate receptor 5 [Arapaima gigas]